MVLTLERSVLLVGLPGAGKTKVGRMLGARIGCAFADSDEMVEREAGRPIPAIFAEDGEAAFRALERRLILSLLAQETRVIALGGGGFSDPAVRAAARANATVFWLDVPEDLLAARIAASGGRPLFDGRDIAETLSELIARRAPDYAEAHHRIAAATSSEMEAQILRILHQCTVAIDRPLGRSSVAAIPTTGSLTKSR